MHNAGHQYGQGAVSSHPTPPFLQAAESNPSGGTTSSLRQFRKKDNVEKQTTPISESASSAPSAENSAHVARVAPHNHYPRSSDYYRYPQFQDYGLSSPVKYSDIAEPPPQHLQHAPDRIPQVIQKQKGKDYMDLCGAPQAHLKQNYQDHVNSQQNYSGESLHAHSLLLKDAPPQPQQTYKPESQYYPKEQYQQIPKYSVPTQSRKYQPGDNDFLTKLSKINPNMANTIWRDYHIREQQNSYPNPMDQNRMYSQNQRYYQALQPNAYPTNYSMPQPYPNYPQSCSYKPEYPRTHQMRYPPISPHMDRSISPRRTYTENYPPLTYPPSMQKMPPNYPQYNTPEYAQHYQHRRTLPPQEYYQQAPCRPSQYHSSHQLAEMPENRAGTSENLKQFIENWADEETATEMEKCNMRPVRDEPSTPVETVLMINASELQYLENSGISENAIPLVVDNNTGVLRFIDNNTESSAVEQTTSTNDKVVNLHIVESKTDCMLANKTDDRTSNVVIHSNTVLQLPSVSQTQPNSVIKPTRTTPEVPPEIKARPETADKNCSPINMDQLEECKRSPSPTPKPTEESPNNSGAEEELSDSSTGPTVHIQNQNVRVSAIDENNRLFTKALDVVEELTDDSFSITVTERSEHYLVKDMPMLDESSQSKTKVLSSSDEVQQSDDNLTVLPNSSSSENRESDLESILEEPEETPSNQDEVPIKRRNKRIFSVDDIIGIDPKKIATEKGLLLQGIKDFIEKEKQLSEGYAAAAEKKCSSQEVTSEADKEVDRPTEESTSVNCVMEVDAEAEEEVGDSTAPSNDVQYRSVLRIEGNNVLLEMCDEVFEMSISIFNDKKKLTVTPISDTLIVDFNDNYEIDGNNVSEEEIEAKAEENPESETKNEEPAVLVQAVVDCDELNTCEEVLGEAQEVPQIQEELAEVQEEMVEQLPNSSSLMDEQFDVAPEEISVFEATNEVIVGEDIVEEEVVVNLTCDGNPDKVGICTKAAKKCYDTEMVVEPTVTEPIVEGNKIIFPVVEEQTEEPPVKVPKISKEAPPSCFKKKEKTLVEKRRKINKITEDLIRKKQNIGLPKRSKRISERKSTESVVEPPKTEQSNPSKSPSKPDSDEFEEYVDFKERMKARKLKKKQKSTEKEPDAKKSASKSKVGELKKTSTDDSVDIKDVKSTASVDKKQVALKKFRIPLKSVSDRPSATKIKDSEEKTDKVPIKQSKEKSSESRSEMKLRRRKSIDNAVVIAEDQPAKPSITTKTDVVEIPAETPTKEIENEQPKEDTKADNKPIKRVTFANVQDVKQKFNPPITDKKEPLVSIIKSSSKVSSQVLPPSISELLQEQIRESQQQKRKLSLQEYNSRKRKPSSSEDSSSSKQHILEDFEEARRNFGEIFKNPRCKSLDELQVKEPVLKRQLSLQQEASSRTQTYLFDWEETQSPKHNPSQCQAKEESGLSEFSGLINSKITKPKCVIDINDLTPNPVEPSQSSQDEILQIYKEQVHSKLNSLNIQIPKLVKSPERKQLQPQISNGGNPAWIRRFLRSEKLTPDEIEKIKEIITYKRLMQNLVNKPSTSYEIRKQCESDVNDIKLHLKKVPEMRKFERFVLESDDTTDEATANGDDESDCSDRIDKNSGDYSVVQSNSIVAGVPKLIIKRRTELPQPIVRLERLDMNLLINNKRKCC